MELLERCRSNAGSLTRSEESSQQKLPSKVLACCPLASLRPAVVTTCLLNSNGRPLFMGRQRWPRRICNNPTRTRLDTLFTLLRKTVLRPSYPEKIFLRLPTVLANEFPPRLKSLDLTRPLENLERPTLAKVLTKPLEKVPPDELHGTKYE